MGLCSATGRGTGEIRAEPVGSNDCAFEDVVFLEFVPQSGAALPSSAASLGLPAQLHLSTALHMLFIPREETFADSQAACSLKLANAEV